uniref:Uncharacterized protein n=1 Tax=Arion vulgaris TaxID=1028688 RepID=A0A0B7AK42_9EUPU
MIQLKEIKSKEYMKGTRAFRAQLYVYIGMIGFTAICSVPAYFYYMKYKAPTTQKKREDEEEDRRQRLEQLYHIQEDIAKKMELKKKESII